MKKISYMEWRQNNLNFFESYDPLLEGLCDVWFKYRYIGSSDENKFTNFFKRSIDEMYPRYKEELKLELLHLDNKIDYFVYNYDESWNYIKNNGNNTSNSENTNNNKSNTSDNTTDLRLISNSENTENTKLNTGTQKSENTSSVSSSGKSEGNGTSNTTNTSSSDSNNKALNSALPMSITNTSGIFNDAFTWNTASSKSEDKNISNSNSTATGENASSSTSTSTANTTGENVRTDDLSEDFTGNKTFESKDDFTSTKSINTTSDGKNTVNTTITNNGESLNLRINTGRSGKSPAEVLDEAIKFIRKYCSWSHLYNDLNKCFLCVVDMDELDDF